MAEERKKIEKVADGKVKKKTGVTKFAETFVSEDVHTVRSYILKELVGPWVRDLLYNVIESTANMFIYGGTGGRNKKTSNASRVSYRSYYDDKKNTNSIDNNRARNGYSYDDVKVDTRGEAEEVLTRMDELIDTYGVVSVADLYDLVGITGNYTDEKYGWTNLRNAEPIRVRDGYLLKLPKPGPLN